MGILEKEIKNEIRISKIQSVVLQTVATAGILSIALLAPNAVKTLSSIFGLNKIGSKNRIRSINNSRTRLVKAGLLKYTKEGFLSLTPTGTKVLYKIEIKNFTIKKPKKWDGKWRVLIFDIKETQKNIRNNIRTTLNRIGFIKLQNSVWVYPYDCEDYITLLKADFKIGREVLYMIVDKIENDKPLLSFFKLSK